MVSISSNSCNARRKELFGKDALAKTPGDLGGESNMGKRRGWE